MNDDLVIERILAREGGYVDHPADRGGPTKYGITRETLEHWRGYALSADEVAKLTKDEAKQILRFRYIVQPGFDHIDDDRLRAIVVDTAVHSGPRQATILLQRALDVEEDGLLGPVTLNAANQLESTDLEKLMVRVLTARMRFLVNLVLKSPDQLAFLSGWTERVMCQIEAVL